MRRTFALIGLPPAERLLLESIFELDAEHGRGLEQVRRAEDAHLLIVNGDDYAAVEQLGQRCPGALMVLVGRAPAGVNVPTIARPLDVPGAVRVLGTLDWPSESMLSVPPEFVGTFTPSHPYASQFPPADGIKTAASIDALAFAPTTASMPLSQSCVMGHAAAAVPEPTSVAVESGPAPLTETAPAADIVMVARLGQRSHTLPAGLRRLGFRVRVAEPSETLLPELALQRVPFVLLDQASLGNDLLTLARALGAQRAQPDGAPHVVVVGRRGSVFDRLRVRLTGGAWMQVPIDRERLLAYFARRGLYRRS